MLPPKKQEYVHGQVFLSLQDGKTIIDDIRGDVASMHEVRHQTVLLDNLVEVTAVVSTSSDDVEPSPDGQPYELFMFAKKHGIGLDRARGITALHGADRTASDLAAAVTLPIHLV